MLRCMSLRLNLTADEVLTTTRSVRKRLDFDRPVDRKLVEECIEIALQAPTGSNSQGWAFVVVEDAAKKKAIADYYGKNFDVYANSPARQQFKEGDLRATQADGVRSSATYLRENFHRVPFMVIPVIRGSRRWPAWCGVRGLLGIDPPRRVVTDAGGA